jgi:hypothetical protein
VIGDRHMHYICTGKGYSRSQIPPLSLAIYNSDEVNTALRDSFDQCSKTEMLNPRYDRCALKRAWDTASLHVRIRDSPRASSDLSSTIVAVHPQFTTKTRPLVSNSCSSPDLTPPYAKASLHVISPISTVAIQTQPEPLTTTTAGPSSGNKISPPISY